MFIDARQIAAESVVEADVCIAGAGAAGITLAREFARGNLRVVLLESGGFEPDDATQRLYAGEVIGRGFTPLDADRLRYLGGTTNHWTGSCKPFDPVDFAARPYIVNSGWPFSRESLDPYYRRAQEVCQLGPYDYALESWQDGAAAPLPLADGSHIRTGVFQFSPPTRFGQVYRQDLADAANILVHLNANVIDIVLPEDGGSVDRLAVRCLDGRGFAVKARFYVLAMGGIEIPRLLLNSDRVQRGGVGNGHDNVGRYFMDHPGIYKSGEIVFNERYPALAFYDFHVVKGIKIQGYFTATAEAQREAGLPNFMIAMDRATIADESPAAASLRTIYKALRQGHAPDELTYHLGRVVRDMDSLVAAAYRRLSHQEPAAFSTFYGSECPPDPESRVTLSDERDALGMRRVRLDWRLPSDFERQMRAAHELLGRELGRAGLGRLRINSRETTQDPMQAIENGHHHMGTTRMHDDPRQGVVDADCRVHGVANLYIAGSAVFPTYSFDDPTLTLVALALRLADHLKDRAA
jgi:choline dehydrogenase-like flavoprotein